MIINSVLPEIWNLILVSQQKHLMSLNDQKNHNSQVLPSCEKVVGVEVLSCCVGKFHYAGVLELQY